MGKQKLWGAAAFALALGGGAVAGATLGTPDLAIAQDVDDTTTTTEAATTGRPWRHHRGEALGIVAQALGISEEELLAELRDGSSIAEVAEARGVDVDVVVDALVAHATERLEELEASLPERMTALVERDDWAEHRPRGWGHHRRGPAWPGADAGGQGTDSAG